MNGRRGFLAALLVLGVQAAHAGFVVAGQSRDDAIQVHVEGDASTLGWTASDADPMPVEEALARLMPPDWEIVWMGTPRRDAILVGWSRGTHRIEVLDEMSRRAGLRFYVEADRRRLTVERGRR